uniref:TBC1 domain family member 17-like isoform X1 n=1 Tax=Styela clava TaxID=7725 RepID=UPI00193AB915|nr:TBC1 domain family member 17-like isoform X1 [Styela clava]
MAESQDYQDVYEQGGVFINAKEDEQNGGDILLGGTLYITEMNDKRYIKWIVYHEPDKNNSEKDDTYTLDGESSSVLHSHSRDDSLSSVNEYQPIDPDWTLINNGGQTVAFLKVDKDGKKMQRGSLSSEAEADEEAAKYNISVEIAELDLMKRSKRGLGWPNVTLWRKDGSVLPTFHFHDKGCKKFIKTLKMYAYAMPFPKDPYTFRLTQHDDNALTRSFDELQLFGSSPAANNDTSRLFKDSSDFALRSFSRVTNFLQNIMVPSEHPSNRPAKETAQVVSEDLIETIGTSRIQIQPDETQTNGFEVITCAQLGPRSEQPRGLPVTNALLETHKDEEGRIHRVDELMWAIFHGGIDPSLRKELWKYMLKYYDWNMTKQELADRRRAKEDDYYRMKMQWKSIDEDQQKRFALLRERKNLVEKDVIRTDRTRMFYKEDGNLSLKLLFDILMTYCMHNFDLGYVQGMSDLLSPLLEVLENEVDAFWCFVGYMDLVHHNFEANQAGMKRQLGELRVLLQFMEPQLWDHLDEKESANVYFCFRWLLIHFKREFSYEDIQPLWEVLWSGLPCCNFHLLICVAILETEKHNLMKEECGFTEILKHINELAGNINLDETLRKAYGIYEQLSACKQDLPDSVKFILGFNE